MRTPLEAKREASVITMKGREMSGKCNTGTVWNVDKRVENVDCWSGPQLHGMLFQVSAVSVMVRGTGLFFSILHLPLLTDNSLSTFTVLVFFFADTFRYIVW